MGRRTGLSKSRITLFEQCPKRLWLSVHRPEEAAEDDVTRANFATGHQVGAIACALHPEGHMIGATEGLGQAAEETAALLAAGWRAPIFEATFVRDDVLVRLDLMIPTGDGWHVAEVKSTTGVKAYHLPDLATQLWVLEGVGVPVSTASIRHIDRSFVLQHDGDYRGLFADTVVDEQVAPIVRDRDGIVASAREILAGDEPPREIGDHCDTPFSCSFKVYCGRHLPPGPEWPASLLPDIAGKKVARLWWERGGERSRRDPTRRDAE